MKQYISILFLLFATTVAVGQVGMSDTGSGGGSSADSTSAGNLLTETGNEIKLGGTADQNTTLDIGVYNFNLSRSLGNFNVYGNDGTNYGSFGSAGNNTQIIHYNTAATHSSKFRIDKDSAIIAWTIPTTSRFKLTPDTLYWNDAVKFEDYGSGTNSGTETYLAAFDADGDLIEVDPSTVGSSGTVTGSGTDGYISNWNGTDALEDSPIYTDGTNVGIGTASLGAILTIGSSSPAISTDTNNASDTKSLILTGGGAASISRGGVINIFGNEHATNPGNIHITGGDVGGAINFYTDPYVSPTATFAGSSVGINQTAPSAKLHIKGSGSGTGKSFFVENNLGDDNFVIQDDAKTGINTLSPDGLLDVEESTAGTANNVYIQHTDNTNAGSDAILNIKSGGASGGDPYILFDIASTKNYSIGIDNSDSDRLVIGASTPGTNPILTMSSTEVIIYSDLTLDSANDVRIISGSGTPESAVTAGVGSTYHRTDGGASTSFYVKESGTGNTGWVAK